MRYFGGKARIAKPLTDFLNSQLRPQQPFVDAFCGSLNVTSKIDPNRLITANDKHMELIALWQYVQAGGVLPENISEEEYKLAKTDDRAWYRAFVGFGCSFAGKYFGGYAREGKRGEISFAKYAKNSITKKFKTIGDNVLFTCADYQELVIPQISMIYCDIPYKDSTGYSVGKFNHNEFYEWAQYRSSQGHEVYVSEYVENVPDFATVVWEHRSRKSIRDASGMQVNTAEVLFTV